MNSRERFYGALHYTGFDRFPTRHYGTPEINGQLLKHFSLSSMEELRLKVGDDFRFVGPEYVGPELKRYPDESWEGLWKERYNFVSFGDGSYPEAVYLPFQDMTDPGELEGYPFPNADQFDYSRVKEECLKNRGYAICIEGAGTPDFMNGIARCRGVEQVLCDIALEDPVYLALFEQRHAFLLEKSRRTLQAGGGLVDVLCLGEDYGTQNGLMIGPAVFDRLFAPKMKQFFDLAHEYGAKAMMHCCGSCRELIPRFIELGLDILEVVQVDAARMDIQELHRDFYKKIAFCGSVSVQTTLPHGSVEDVLREVRVRQRLFKDGGMIIAATHDIQVGTPVENILAMYRQIGSLRE